VHLLLLLLLLLSALRSLLFASLVVWSAGSAAAFFLNIKFSKKINLHYGRLTTLLREELWVM